MGKKDGKKESPPGITINTGEGFMPYLLLQDWDSSEETLPCETMNFRLFFTSLSLVFFPGEKEHLRLVFLPLVFVVFHNSIL